MKLTPLLCVSLLAALPLAAMSAPLLADSRATDLARNLNSQPLSMSSGAPAHGTEVINAHIASDRSAALASARLRLQTRRVATTNFMSNLDLARESTK